MDPAPSPDPPPSLDALLLEQTRVAQRVKREYSRLKADPDARFYTYVLQLQHGKFYVGNTDNVYQRLLDHTGQTPSTSLWVKQHGPVERVVEIARGCGKDDEMYKTLLYMSLFGWQNVRGSGWCKVDLAAPPDRLKNFRRTRDGDFQYLTQAEIVDILAAVRDLRGT